MSAPSILSAIQKLKSLLTREEKLKWLGIMGFALCTSLLEVVTASVIIIFAQVLNEPEVGQKYLNMIGLAPDLAPRFVVLYIAIIVGLVYLVKNIVAAIEVFYQNFSIQKMNYCFKNKLLYQYAKTDYGVYLTRNASLGGQVVGSDAERLFSIAMISLATILSEGTIFIFLIGMVVYINPSLAAAIFSIAAVLSIIITKGVLPHFYGFGKKLQEAGFYAARNLTQFFHGFKEILLFGKRDTFINEYQYYSRKTSRVQAMQTAINSLPRMVIEVLFMGLFVTTIAFLCLEHESPLQMMGILGGYLYTGFRLMPGLNRLIGQLNFFKSAIPSIERVYSEYTEVGAKESYLDVPAFEFNHTICLKGVSFAYLNTDRDALSHVSLEIKKGECIGIVGETGSGKSTLVDLILGLLRPYEGSVLIDGKFPANAYQWHKKIGYVSQSIYLIDDTIEANIAFGESKINTESLEAAIDAAQLRKFIDGLLEKTKTVVGERGIRLSGGERQRIAIARALYRNPEVLIFDEATSALDHETETRLMETIHAVSQDRTVIMVAHRVTTLKDCDRIVVIENGKVAEIIAYNNLFLNQKPMELSEHGC